MDGFFTDYYPVIFPFFTNNIYENSAKKSFLSSHSEKNLDFVLRFVNRLLYDLNW